MKRGSKFKFRRIYFYFCQGCGKRRGTRIYERRENELCTLCRKRKVNENQLSMIPHFEILNDRRPAIKS